MSALLSPTRTGSGIAAILVALFLHAVPAAAQKLERLEIVTRTGVHVFDIEMAATPEERSKGLMFRRELPQGQGMLFDFEGDGPIAMWMRNTHISLDMIFIRADGHIARIAENTVPMSETTIPSGAPVKAVLEVIAGTAKRLGIAPGDRIAHRIFGKR